ncbi:MAG: hypothetical protein JOZ57_02870 [Abitibacteriaceae bacterium]|nr:hypothetical protein [Abditibacteriaceae bacterium]
MKLATSANLNLSDTELGFLRRLQEFTIWAGRYPIALDAQKYADGEKYLNLSANDVGLADQLFQSLETMLRNQRKPPKDW